MSGPRISLTAIDEKLEAMWRQWNEPAMFRREVVEPEEAGERDELAHADNHDLGDQLAAAQQERDRLHALEMEGQSDLDGPIAALAESVELLQASFLARFS